MDCLLIKPGICQPATNVCLILEIAFVHNARMFAFVGPSPRPQITTHIK